MARNIAEGTDITARYGAIALPLLHMSLGNRVGPVAMALAAMLVTALLSACSSAPQPQPTANAYFAAWTKHDWAAMQQLVSKPAADFTAWVVGPEGQAWTRKEGLLPPKK